MKLSIIIVSFNTASLLDACLASIKAHQYFQIEIVVADNGSTDKSLEVMSNKYPQVKVIQNHENLGYGKANNQAAKTASGDWLLFLNSDTTLLQGTMEKILALLTTLDENEVIGCRLLNPNHTIQPSAGYFPTLSRIFAQMFFLDDLPLIKHWYKPYQQSDTAYYTQSQLPDWVTGAFLLVNKKQFLACGGFDDSIFMYGEEVDLCFRLKAKGCQVRFVPNIEIIHAKGASSINGFEAAVKGEYLGLQTFYQKHYPHLTNWCKRFLYAGSLLRAVIFGMIRPNQAGVYRNLLSGK